MSADTVSNKDVLIVGAGPCGLTLAHELLRRGIQPRIIEKNAAASQNTKALGVMTRTLELLTPSGIAGEMVAQGVKVPAFRVYSEGRQLACFDFTHHVDSAYSYVLTLPQPMTEEILAQHVVELGGNIERGVELINLEQQEEGVEVVLRHADGREERSRTRWLVGCDGAHSIVRHLVGATFVGRTLEQSFATGNVRMHWNVPSDRAFACLKRGDLIAYFPIPGGQHRVVIAYKPEDAPTGEITLDEIQRAIDACGPEGARVSDPTWLARYQINERRVDHYVWQHVVLVGDAAHIHSPVGGQGMNTGMQDAFNLAWKLALVVQGKASERLLESYASEREEVGRQLVQRTGLLTRLALMHQPLAIAARDMIIPHVTRLEKVQQAFTATMAELSIAYRHSPLTSEYHGEKTRSGHSPVKAGDRAPDGPVTIGTAKAPGRLYELLNGNRHVLLIFAHQKEIGSELQNTLSEWQDWLDVYLIQRGQLDSEGEQAYYDPDGSLAQRYGIADEGLVLIRPDGYIALRSQPIATEPLQRYFTTISSPARPSAVVG
ncbi:FAD-dependent monooxygenase [Dictyobacter formicarum]|uniref:Oxygenase n=1 Tax=Dictyobacter formicarum TaxID=2778368 RepID=A0ABQ3VJ15_9CHLR|nr:FAD-dependent monooxygenase [Dictyobacter formicarum]GHO85770.1 oxygenase [Dictyobacter formicarum]